MSSGKRAGHFLRESQAISDVWTRAQRHKYRRSFAERWQSFIATEFEDATHAAYEFGCDPDTAASWLEGRSAPSGPFVGMAFARWPQQAMAYLSGTRK